MKTTQDNTALTGKTSRSICGIFGGMPAAAPRKPTSYLTLTGKERSTVPDLQSHP